MIESYQVALELVDQSGGGLSGAEHTSFYEMIHKKYCKYFDELHEILKDCPTTFAAYTNEMCEED